MNRTTAHWLDLACYFAAMTAAFFNYMDNDLQSAIFFGIVALWFQPKDR